MMLTAHFGHDVSLYIRGENNHHMDKDKKHEVNLRGTLTRLFPESTYFKIPNSISINYSIQTSSFVSFFFLLRPETKTKNNLNFLAFVMRTLVEKHKVALLLSVLFSILSRMRTVAPLQKQ